MEMPQHETLPYGSARAVHFRVQGTRRIIARCIPGLRECEGAGLWPTLTIHCARIFVLYVGPTPASLYFRTPQMMGRVRS